MTGGQKLTPMMEQWMHAKSQHPDAILLFRMGDFYELFGDDALKAAPILELALTCRDKDKTGLKMAGFPIHAADPYIAKLVDCGHKVALCEQLEDPKASKGIVKRGITQVLTPGTIIDAEESPLHESSYLVSVVASEGSIALVALDLNTASFMVTSSAKRARMLDELCRLKPKEIVFFADDEVASKLGHELQAILERHGLVRLEKKSLGQSLPADAESRAQSLIRAYVAELRGAMPSHIGQPVRYAIDAQVLMDEPTRENLDLLPRKKGHKINLLSILQECKTAMGRRLLYQTLIAPSTSLSEINRRHQIVAELSDSTLRKALTEQCASMYDMEKLTALCASNKIGPRGLARLRDCLIAVSAIKALIAKETKAPLAQQICDALPDLTALKTELAQALVEQPPLHLKEGGLFLRGFDEKLDELSELTINGQSMLLALEAREREQTGINSLKIKYTRVFGYYIEITKSNLDRVPSSYQRKQTIANGERYITAELSELEVKLNSAHEQLAERELKLFEQLRRLVVDYAKTLLELATGIAMLDMLAGFAQLASCRNWVRPSMLKAEERLIDIKNGRHPIVEEICLKNGNYFVPNDMRLDSHSCELALVSGPNMAGKSTIMRQAALIQIMAQMGSYVPATSATLSICDSIFARVGASDDLSLGRSTFMVEMTETAYILQHATPQSLVLLDEIGRGTSTYDGVSIAQAVAEYIHDTIQCRTLFATHYHELTELEKSLPRLKNFHVEVEKKPDGVQFLYTLKPGPAEESFGIQVAKLAGLPSTVVERASIVLQSLEEKPKRAISLSKNPLCAQPDLFGQGAGPRGVHPISEQIARLDINRITPLQALNKLSSLQSSIRAASPQFSKAPESHRN